MHALGKRLLIATAATAAALASAVRSPAVVAEQNPTDRPTADAAHVRLLTINDLHGHLEPIEERGRPVGGVAYLASALDAAGRERTALRLSAGDAVGASPLLSGYFNEAPTIEALNAMRFDVATVGNHEFDRGPGELAKLTKRASYAYLAANVVSAGDHQPLFAPYRVFERDGVKIAVIGVTTPGAGMWLLPSFAKQVAFTDISDTVNRYSAELTERGVHAIVVLAHSGSGEIATETRQMSDAVDVVVAGHTHANENLRIGGKLVVQSMSYGTAFGHIDLTIDRSSGEVVASEAEVERTWNDEFDPDPALEALLSPYRRRVEPIATQPAGELTAPADKAPGPDGVSAIGRLVTEAQRRAAHADIAFVNSDWLRAALPAGRLSFEDVYSVQPFGNRVIRMVMSGRDIRGVIERERSGFDLQWTPLPRLEAQRDYAVAVNEFLAGGGERYEEFTRGRDRRDVGLDVDVLRDYLLTGAVNELTGPFRP